MALGMKAHIRVDAKRGLAPTVIATAANVSHMEQAGAVLHDIETAAQVEQGYRGLYKRKESHGPP